MWLPSTELLHTNACRDEDYDDDSDKGTLEPMLAVDAFVDGSAEMVVLDVGAGEGMVAGVADFEV